MKDEELARACVNLRDAGIDFALLSSHESITYAMGFDEPVPIGSARDFAVGLPLALAVLDVREESGVLLVSEGYGEQAARQNRLKKTLPFPVFHADSPVDLIPGFLSRAKEALLAAGIHESS